MLGAGMVIKNSVGTAGGIDFTFAGDVSTMQNVFC